MSEFIIFTHFLFQNFHFELLPFSVSPTCRFHLLVDSITDRPESTILDDFCLANAISKYFSKLRFGTNKIQPELKCLENTLRVFMNTFLRARLLELELYSVRSLAFISTVAKSPDDACNIHQEILVVLKVVFFTVGSVCKAQRLSINQRKHLLGWAKTR